MKTPKPWRWWVRTPVIDEPIIKWAQWGLSSRAIREFTGIDVPQINYLLHKNGVTRRQWRDGHGDFIQALMGRAEWQQAETTLERVIVTQRKEQEARVLAARATKLLRAAKAKNRKTKARAIHGAHAA